MPINMLFVENRFCPTVVCDICGEPITDCDDGICYYNMRNPEGLIYAHDDPCASTITSAQFGAYPLSIILVWLIDSLKMTSEKAREARMYGELLIK